MRSIVLVVAVAGCTAARADRPGDGDGDGEAVLRTHCARCHSGPNARGDFGFVADTQQLIARGFIVPGDASRSAVFERVAAGEMPPPEVARRPRAAEIAALRAWIDSMAATAEFRREDEIAQVLAGDAAALPAATRPFARWLTLTHLANAGVPAAVLARYRRGIAELLASLTWAAAPPSVVAVDAARTIYRIDLRELGWPAATWDAIRARYPYGIARPGVPEALRADWFVAVASRAPLYHAILGLPDSLDELGRRLGVDLAGDVAAARVARAGFASSGVSVNNRVIERHATRHGALWRSYDFASSVGREDAFAHPLDFVPAGGEVIFNLPDGMQAYLLVDAAGRRIDKAPTAIVSDPRRPDRAVATAVSCFGCHASGIIERADQLRDAALLADRAQRERIERLHPPADELAALYARDRARFAAALAAIPGSPDDGSGDRSDEPITALVAHHEAALGLPLAAAELGLAPGELIARLDAAPAVRRLLGALATGGTVKRDGWEAAFPRVVRALGLGAPVRPVADDDPPPRPPVVGIALGFGTARTAALALGDRLAALRAFKVVPLDGGDRATLTHIAELTIDEIAVDRRRHVLCTWFEGSLVGTFAITELATGRAVFRKTVTATAKRRAHFSSRAAVVDLLVEQAVGDWMAAFREARAQR